METTKIEIKNVQKELQEKHPNWPQEKARWIAMQVLGILNKNPERRR